MAKARKPAIKRGGLDRRAPTSGSARGASRVLGTTGPKRGGVKRAKRR